ncbi:MAG TPA: phytoene/squalene synthase family protein [Stellaceae bacterium]|nr:phytoene/squalene synthase family protein [Stellaceae bacterium]
MQDRSTGKTAPSARRSSVAASLSPVALIVRVHDRDRFQIALFAPAEAREALFALYAFNYEIARVRESVREPMLGQIRLQWWREAIDAAYGGAPPRRHEVAEPLTAAIRAHGLGRKHFARLIEARERDLDEAPPATLAALEDYAEGTSAPLIRLALEALGAATPQSLAAATEIGIAYALTGLIRALPLHARAGRTMIPDDVAVETGFDTADYTALRATLALRRAVEAVAGSASRHLDAARAMRRDIPNAALPALLSARIAAHALRRLERAGFDPFSGTGESDPLQSWRLAFAMLRRRF